VFTVYVFFIIPGVMLAKGLARYLRGEDCNGNVTGYYIMARA
jgi:hypothetical protein